MSEGSKIAIIVAAMTPIAAIFTGIISILTTEITIHSHSNEVGQLIEEEQNIKEHLDHFAPPPGTIIAYGGPTNMAVTNLAGWLVCDGQAVSRDTYSNLYLAIGTCWGNGDGAHTFNLPDLRGIFLRGVNGDRTNSFVRTNELMDPDAEGRILLQDGGNAGNKVGSYEVDQFASHSHKTIQFYAHQQPLPVDDKSPTGLAAEMWAYKTRGDPVEAGTDTGSTGGSETRPKNANVYYLIKY